MMRSTKVQISLQISLLIFIVDFLINLFEARGKILDLMFKGSAVILNCKTYHDCTQLIIIDFIVGNVGSLFSQAGENVIGLVFPVHSRTDRSLRRDKSCSYIVHVHRPIGQ